MKPYGAILDFTKQRNDAIFQLYKKYIAAVKHIDLMEIVEKIVNSPAPRFWVSRERATIVVSAMFRGLRVLDDMRPAKREMFTEIYNRVAALKIDHPKWQISRLVDEVINEPAPKFYMEPSSARQCLYKIKNGWYDRKLK